MARRSRHASRGLSWRSQQPTLVLDLDQFRRVVAHCYDGLPDEACGLFGGPLGDDFRPTGEVGAVYPCRNADASARTYTIDSRRLPARDRDARRPRARHRRRLAFAHPHRGLPVGHRRAKAQALGPTWLLAIVSLKRAEPSLRAYRIVGDDILEVPVRVAGL